MQVGVFVFSLTMECLTSATLAKIWHGSIALATSLCFWLPRRSQVKNAMLLTLHFAAAAAKADSAPQFDPQRLSQHVKVLSSNEFEGRGPNTAGETKSVEYLIEQFKAT